MLGNGKKYIINILLILVFTVGALYFVLNGRMNEVNLILAEIEWYDLVLILGWAFSFVAVGGCIVTIITRSFGYRYSFRAGILNNLVSVFFSGITPSASGGQIGQLYIFRKQGVDLSDGGSILWYDFIVYQFVMIAYVLTLLFLRFGYYYNTFSNFYFLIIIGFIINSGVILFLFSMVIFPHFYVHVMGQGVDFFAKIHVIKQPEHWKSRIAFEIGLFKQKIQMFKSKKNLLVQVAFLHFVKLTLFYSVPIAVIIALRIPMTPQQCLDVIALTAFVTMANAFFPVPGASGGTESVFVLMFSNLFGINIASALMLVWRFATYYFMLLIGGVAFVGYKFYCYYHYD
ncbi:MAG: lysylphosphatidylglycerol synthase transmembrane domain-containing protein [Erysipelotrichaceae bacterium]